MSTLFSTLPRLYLVSSSLRHCSTASLMAMPRLPVQSGSSASILLPTSVRSVGLGYTSAPNSLIITFRYGFCS